MRRDNRSAATSLYAESQSRLKGDVGVWDLADEVFHTARKRIDRMISQIIHNDDDVTAAVGRRALLGRYPLLTGGIIQRGLDDYVSKDRVPTQKQEGSYENTASDGNVLSISRP